MPELPEVETIKNDLKERILDKKINKIVVSKKKIIKNKLKYFESVLVGNEIEDIDRVGKLLIFIIKSGDLFLLIHLKMTGQLIYCSKKDIVAGGHSFSKQEKEASVREVKETLCSPNKYSHVIFYFRDGSKLFYNDMRQFGYLKIVDGSELEKIKKKFGPEPLAKDFKFDDFRKILKKRTAPIKAILLNQQLIAGIGNIYADEILFRARVMPSRPANSLTAKEAEDIFRASKIIFKKAIKERGTTFNNYVDGHGRKGGFLKLLKVYRREGEECRRCGSVIKKAKMAGRNTRFCLQCQK